MSPCLRSFLLFCLGIVSCLGQIRNFDVLSTVPSTIPLTTSVSYSCVFVNRWTKVRHPNRFPTDPHWSPMVIVGHSPMYRMWSNATMASAGIETVAEEGSPTSLVAEMEKAGSSTNEPAIGKIMFNKLQSSQTVPNFMVDSNNYLVSSISMIAPSPDWFTGFYGFDARSKATSTWYQFFSIATYPWDAGTEQGDRYTFTNAASSPKGRITRFSPRTVPMSTKVFLSSDGTKVPNVARWACTMRT